MKDDMKPPKIIRFLPRYTKAKTKVEMKVQWFNTISVNPIEPIEPFVRAG
jgi:hypothetical protein